MFKRKTCPNCKERIEKNYEFCPYCGENLKSRHYNEDYGFLGKNDFIDEKNFMPFGNSFIDKMINQTMKMIEKQMKNMPNELNKEKFPQGNIKIRFMINGKEIVPQNLQKQPIKKPIKPIKTSLPRGKEQKFAKLPRKEPKTIMKRIGEKIVYEISMPGVKDIEDVLINQLENSIEIKALSKNKVYSKILNINLPILSYQLDKGNLVLELQAK